MTDEPLFKHAHAALVFAFRYSSQSGPPPTGMAKMMRGPVASGNGLVGLDGAAQAGLIRAMVGELRPIHRHIIIARFAVDLHESIPAQLALIPHAGAQLGSGIQHRRLIDHLVQKYFGRRWHLGDIAESCGVHRNTMTEKWRLIRDRFRTDESSANEEIGARFQGAGLTL